MTLRALAVAITLSCALASAASAQDAPGPPPASILVQRATFSSWTGEAQLTTTGSNLAVTRDPTLLWWGLGRGATVGAATALTLTQAFCADDNGCVGRSIGAVLMGSLLGGALESGMDY